MKKPSLITYLAAFFVVFVGLIFVWDAYVPSPVKAKVTVRSHPEPYKLKHFPELPAERVRPLFRFSLIPRGASSVGELRAKVAADPILTAAFVGFDFEHARAIRIADTIQVFTTFRKGDDVRWTQCKITINAGELAFTDGERTFLARCGNEISWNPQEPSDPLDPSVLEKPDAPKVPEFPVQLYSTLFPPDSIPPVDGFEPTKPGQVIPPEIFVPIGTVGITTTLPVIPTTPLPSPAPEPQSFFLFGAGALVLMVRAKKFFL